MQFIYVMDPMCSWCWAFAPVIKSLKAQYPGIPISLLMGGLAPDSDQPMPREMQLGLQQTWKHIEQHTATSFNHGFWGQCQPRRSTYPACRAVLAAGQIEPDSSEAMIEAIQRAYYQQARNPSDSETLCELAGEIGLDEVLFSEALTSEETEQQLQAQLALKERWQINGFPTLLLAEEDTLKIVTAGYCDWETLEARLRQMGI